ncbi:MAG: hypothetical protein KFF77_09880 [Bacteroidetes bacterium]|nr:hypothetical protein [Bacteroidota bacterium]
MRIPLIFILLTIPCHLFSQDGPDSAGAARLEPLGPRVGSVIDSTERVYFNLFPDVDEFVSARLEPAHDLVVVTIFTGGPAGRQLRLTPRDAAFLRWYLDNFEAITHREEGSASSAMIARAPDLNLLRSLSPLLDIGVFDPVSRRTMSEASHAQVVLFDSSSHSGPVLWNDTAAIALWTGGGPFIANRVNEQLRIIPVDSIVELRTRVPIGFYRAFRNVFPLLGAITYKLIGGMTFNTLEHEDVLMVAAAGLYPALYSAIPAALIALIGKGIPVPHTIRAGMDTDDVRDALDRLATRELFIDGLPLELRYAIRDFRLSHAVREDRPPATAPVPSTKRKPSIAGLWIGGETVVSMFGARTQPYGTGLGVTASFVYPLLRQAETEWELGIRPRIAAGLTYLSGEMVVTTQLNGRFYLCGGLTWLWTDEPDRTATGRSGGGHSDRYEHDISVDRSSFWKQTSVTVGLGYLIGASSIELQYRRLPEPVLSGSTTVYPGAFSYPNITPYTEDLGSWAYSTVSVIYSWRL